VLNGELIAADLVDVVNLTLSGHTAAGPGPRVAMNATEVLHRFTPEHSVTRNSMLFTRWRRHRD
jgi:hypothetical protein